MLLYHRLRKRMGVMGGGGGLGGGGGGGGGGGAGGPRSGWVDGKATP